MSNDTENFLFSNVRRRGKILTDLNKQVSDVLRTKLKSVINTFGLKFGDSKIGLHCFRRGPVTASVNAETAPINVQKLMRVASTSMVAYYATIDLALLLKTSKTAF